MDEFEQDRMNELRDQMEQALGEGLLVIDEDEKDDLDYLARKLDVLKSAQKILDKQRAELVRRVDEVQQVHKQDRQEWLYKKSLVDFFLSPSDAVEFNVSGSVFKIKIEDLTKYESSVLASMLDGQQEVKGQIYIQRDPDMFKLMMKFLRAQTANDFKNLRSWTKLTPEESQELSFWQLDEDYKIKVPEPAVPAVSASHTVNNSMPRRYGDWGSSLKGKRSYALRL